LSSGYENVQLVNSVKVKNQVDKVGLTKRGVNPLDSIFYWPILN
jgi:hypothetical protein